MHKFKYQNLFSKHYIQIFMRSGISVGVVKEIKLEHENDFNVILSY